MVAVVSDAGWCGHAWPGDSSWPYAARVDLSIAHQIDIQGSQVLGHQTAVQPNEAMEIGHQTEIHIQDFPTSAFHQFVISPLNDGSPFGHQFLISTAGCDDGGWASAPWPGYSSWAYTKNCRVAYGHQIEFLGTSFVGHQILLDLPALSPAIHHQYLGWIDTNTAGVDDVTPHQYLTEIDSHVAGVDEVIGHQFEIRIDTQDEILHQYTTRIDTSIGVFHQYLAEIDSHVAGVDSVNYQQFNVEVDTLVEHFHQFNTQINVARRAWHQYNTRIDAVSPFLHQYLYNSPYFNVCGNWCANEWPGITPWAYTCQLNKLTAQQYLSFISTHVAGTSPINLHQITISPRTSVRVRHQINIQSVLERLLRSQYTYVFAPDVFGASERLRHQINIQTTRIILHQLGVKLYNTDHIRILWEIASDGLTFNNVGASSNAGQDFLPINLKSDIVEQKWRSGAALEEWIQVDCGAGITRIFDTIALISTNLSPGAVVRIYGFGGPFEAAPPSDDLWYAMTPYAIMQMPNANENTEDVIWIAPVQPLVGYRHWRIRINDENNPDGYIEIGRFAAGESMIFVNENYTMDVDFSDINFKDEVSLNGFTSIANNRALKRRLRLTFNDLNLGSQQNYRNLKSYLRYCRDTLKALVIPDPRHPYLYTVFSKISEMPTQQHRYIDADSHYSSMTIEWDEAK